MTAITELEKEIERTRQYLQKLESKLHRVRYGKDERMKHEVEKERLHRVELEFRRKYSNVTLGPNVLSIAGILPSAGRAHDKKILRQALAEKYG